MSDARAPRAVSCEGAPRDLGYDQARTDPGTLRALGRGAVPSRFARFLEGEARVDRVLRDVTRFFPHMAERAIGLASGARTERIALAGLLERELDAASGVSLGVTAERSGTTPLLARSVEAFDATATGPLLLRRSHPELDFRSVEIARLGEVPALAGVNEKGLAVVAGSLPATEDSVARCAAPGLLLAQDCLQRFADVESAVEWCERRPAGGRFSILLADAEGACTAVKIDGTERSLVAPQDGLLLGLCDPVLTWELPKRLAERGAATPDALLHLMHEAEPAALLHVLVDPAARRLAWATPRARWTWEGIDAR